MAILTTSFQKIATTKYTVVGNNELRLYAKYNSQNTSTLKTNVTFELRTQALSGSFYSEGNSAILKIDNVSKGTKNYDIGTVTTSSEKTLTTWTFDISHTSAGTYSGTAQASANVYGNLNPSVSADFSLPNIAVNPTLVINSSTDMTTSGSTINYTLGSTNGRSTKIQYSTNNSTWVDWKTKTSDNTYSETLPSLLSSFPNTYTPTVYFRAITGNYSSGSKSKTITISSSIKPSISSVVINPVNTYSVLTNNNLFVKTLTKPRITTTASAYSNGGATLSQYDLTALGGYNSSISKTNVGNNYTYGTAFQKSGSYTATVKVIDTRGGNVSKTSSAITVIDYYNPSITSVSVQRCLQNGTLSDAGTYCKLSVTYKIAPITSGSTSYNTKSLSYSINNTTGSITLSGYSGTATAIVGGGNLSTNSSYPVTVTLKDLTTTVTQTTTLPTSFVLVSKKAGGKGITYGAIAEQDNLHYYMDAYFHNNIYFNSSSLNSDINDAITLGLTENTAINITTAYAIVKIPLDTIKTQKNTNSTFSLQNNEIKINKAGYYLVNANILSNSADTSQTIIGNIYRTRSNTNSYLAEGYALVTKAGYYTIGLTPMIIYLNQNDTVGLGVSGSKTENITVAGTRFTYLTVMKL